MAPGEEPTHFRLVLLMLFDFVHLENGLAFFFSFEKAIVVLKHTYFRF